MRLNPASRAMASKGAQQGGIATSRDDGMVPFLHAAHPLQRVGVRSDAFVREHGAQGHDEAVVGCVDEDAVDAGRPGWATSALRKLVSWLMASKSVGLYGSFLYSSGM